MKYATSSRKARRRSGIPAAFGTFVLVAGILGVFVYSVIEFRKPRASAPVESAVASVTPTTSLLMAPLENRGNEAQLIGINGTTAIGTATRSTEDKAYRLRVKTNLPDMDRVTQAYEVWLVRPIPYDFFSVGEMVTNDAGDFVLEWAGESGKTYDDYARVVITLEAKDGNPDPSGHVMNGEFE